MSPSLMMDTWWRILQSQKVYNRIQASQGQHHITIRVTAQESAQPGSNQVNSFIILLFGLWKGLTYPLHSNTQQAEWKYLPVFNILSVKACPILKEICPSGLRLCLFRRRTGMQLNILTLSLLAYRSDTSITNKTRQRRCFPYGLRVGFT